MSTVPELASSDSQLLISRVNDIISLSASGSPVNRLSDLVPLVQRLVDERDEAVRKQRIANDRLVDLELSGVTGREVHSSEILHATLQRREEEIRKLLSERERILEQTADEVNRISSQLAEERSKDQHAIFHLSAQLDAEKAEKQNLARLVKDTDRLRQEAEKAERCESTIKSLESQLRKLNNEQVVPLISPAEVTSLQDQLARSRRRVTELESHAKSQTREIDLMKLKVKSESDHSSVAESKIAQLGEQLAKATRQLERSDAMNREMLKEKESLVESLEHTGRDAETLHGIVAALRRQMEATRLDSDQRAAQMESLSASLHACETERLSLQNVIGQLQRQIGERESLLHDLKVNLHRGEGEVTALHQQLKAVSFERDNLVGKLTNQAKFSMVSYAGEVSALKKQGDDQLHQIHHLESLLGEREADVVDMQTELDMLRQERDETEARKVAARDDIRQKEADEERVNLLKKTKESLAALEVVSLALTETLKTVESLKEENAQIRNNVGGIESSMQPPPRKTITDSCSQTSVPASAPKDEIAQTSVLVKENVVQTVHSDISLKGSGVQTEPEVWVLNSVPMTTDAIVDEIPVLMESVLVDDDLLEEPVGIESELRLMISEAGWGDGTDDDQLVALVKENVGRMMEYAQDLELETEYLRSELETQMMRSEENQVSHHREIDRLDSQLQTEIDMRKSLQESAVSLADKTTQLWNKYGSNSKSLRSALN